MADLAALSAGVADSSCQVLTGVATTAAPAVCVWPSRVVTVTPSS